MQGYKLVKSKTKLKNKFVIKIEADYNDADYMKEEVTLSKKNFEMYLPYIKEVLKPHWQGNLDGGRERWVRDNDINAPSEEEKVFYKPEGSGLRHISLEQRLGEMFFGDKLEAFIKEHQAEYEEYGATIFQEDDDFQELYHFICYDLIPGSSGGFGGNCHSIESIDITYYDENGVKHKVELID